MVEKEPRDFLATTTKHEARKDALIELLETRYYLFHLGTLCDLPLAEK